MSHKGRWVHVQSYSGQDDAARIECECGWRSAKIWSRLDIENVKAAFWNHHPEASE